MMYTRWLALAFSLYFFFGAHADAACDFNCDSRCCTERFGIKVCEPLCYSTCLQAQAACQVVPPAANLVARNLTIALIVDPVQTQLLLTLSFILTRPDFPPTQTPIPVPKDIPPTGRTFDIQFDCLYTQSFNQVPVYTALSESGKPSHFDELHPGDRINATASNSSCSPLSGWTLTPSASFLEVGTYTLNTDHVEYSVVGRAQGGQFFSAQGRVDLGPGRRRSNAFDPDRPALYGIVVAKGTETVVVDPIADRTGGLVEFPASKVSLSETGLEVSRTGRTQKLTKIVIDDKAALNEVRFTRGRDLLRHLSGARNFTPVLRTPVGAKSFAGDIECTILKTTPLYWQAYAFVKYAKDVGLLRNASQCQDASYVSAVVGEILGAEEGIVGLVVGAFGECICRDLF